MTVVVVLNGAPPTTERLRELAGSFPVVAADGGAMSCFEAGVTPLWVAGDLDSAVRDRLPADWELRHYPEQTRTDFQKVMGDLGPEMKEVLILGGLGRRTDHLITNLMIAATLDASLRIRFEAEEESLFRVTPEVRFERDLPPGQVLSLLPLPEATGVQTRGLRWNLDQAEMRPGGQLGQSNEVTGPVSVTVSAGCLYVWTPRLEEGGQE
jgi:thiamine pyrophosphokinase